MSRGYDRGGGEKGQGQGDREKGRETGKGDRERGDSQARIEIGEREARRDRRGGRALFVNKMPSLLECLGVLTAHCSEPALLRGTGNSLAATKHSGLAVGGRKGKANRDLRLLHVPTLLVRHMSVVVLCVYAFPHLLSLSLCRITSVSLPLSHLLLPGAFGSLLVLIYLLLSLRPHSTT